VFLAVAWAVCSGTCRVEPSPSSGRLSLSPRQWPYRRSGRSGPGSASGLARSDRALVGRGGQAAGPLEGHANLGKEYLAKGDLVRAREHSARALQLNPRNAIALANLGIVEANRGNTEAAVQLLPEPRRRLPPSTNYFNLAVLQARLGRYEEAAASLREVLAQEPRFPRGELPSGEALPEIRGPSAGAAPPGKGTGVQSRAQPGRRICFKGWAMSECLRLRTKALTPARPFPYMLGSSANLRSV